MGRLLLFCLMSVYLVTAAAMGRVLPEASFDGAAAELGAAGAAVLPPADTATHEGELVAAASPPVEGPPPSHRPFDRSVAGAEVMLGGLATAVLAAVFCYIRVTRRRSQDPHPTRAR